MSSVKVWIRCADCGELLAADSEAYSGESISIDAVLEDHYCGEEEER